MKHKIAALVLGTSLLLTMACGPCNLIQGLLKEKAAEIGATVVATMSVPLVATVAPPAPGETSQPTPPPQPTPTPIGAGQPTPTPSKVSLGEDKVAVPADTLRSYRAHQSTKVQQGDKPWSPEVKMDIEWTSEPEKALHVIMYGPSGSPVSEFITIGSKTWLKSDGKWYEIPGDRATENSQPPVNVDQVLSNVQKPPKPLGTEEVNGVRCQQYLLDTDFTVTAGGDTTRGHITGNIWVADQSDIPPVVVKSRTKTLVKVGGEKATVAEERELYDINAPITIEPPIGK